MGFLDKLFGDKPSRPDDYEQASKIASLIDAFVSIHGMQALVRPTTAIVMGQEFNVAILNASETNRKTMNLRAIVYLNTLPAVAEYKETLLSPQMGGGVFPAVATDRLAIQTLQELNRQSRE